MVKFRVADLKFPTAKIGKYSMENTHTLRSDGSKIGVVHIPKVPRTGNPAFLFINTRDSSQQELSVFYIKAAQELANIGFHVLRLSPTTMDRGSTAENESKTNKQRQPDITAGIDTLCNSYQCESIVSSGYRSGADDSIIIASEDRRVKGIFLIDGPGFRTPRFSFNNVIFRFFRSENKTPKSQNNKAINTNRSPAGDRPHLEKKTLVPLIENLVRREVKMHFLFTKGAFQYYNYTGQASDMFKHIDLRGTLTESFHSDCSDLLVARHHHQAIIGNMLSWTEKLFEEQGAVGSAVRPELDASNVNDDDTDYPAKAA